MDKPTQGMWIVGATTLFTDGVEHVSVNAQLDPSRAVALTGLVSAHDAAESLANAELIAAAVNACKKVNESDPLSVASQIEAAFQHLQFIKDNWALIRAGKAPVIIKVVRDLEAILSAAKEA